MDSQIQAGINGEVCAESHTDIKIQITDTKLASLILSCEDNSLRQFFSLCNVSCCLKQDSFPAAYFLAKRLAVRPEPEELITCKDAVYLQTSSSLLAVLQTG